MTWGSPISGNLKDKYLQRIAKSVCIPRMDGKHMNNIWNIVKLEDDSKCHYMKHMKHSIIWNQCFNLSAWIPVDGCAHGHLMVTRACMNLVELSNSPIWKYLSHQPWYSHIYVCIRNCIWFRVVGIWIWDYHCYLHLVMIRCCKAYNISKFSVVLNSSET